MATNDLYTKGARLWIPDPDTVWKGAEVVKDISGSTLIVEFDDGENGRKLTLTIKKPEDLPPLRNPDILIGENDLTSLSYLNEPEVLYNLKVRFGNHNAIYTYCGIVLVAINPYEDLPIYSNDTIAAYRGQAMGDLDPHIFAVAEEAYTKMEREDQNQSIIVSGESGAGKTVSAKYAMRYFATVGGNITETQVEKKVLASNPIMEAIGNAKTTRNDNSSRFGKYIEIDFSKQYHIVGANMRTYLLEKSRVVFQANDERNYHIFYQLCASADLPEFVDLHLGHADNFRYTNQGESPVIVGVDDKINFEETRIAFTLLGFSNHDQKLFFRILAAILHFGNVEFLVKADGKNNEECCVIANDDQHLMIATALLGIDRQQLATWLCNRKIVSMKEVFTKPMNVSEAVFARDALAKHIYAQLFSRIVLQINKALASSEKVHKFIGVLDIYGFETFETNSFEQFCINYANEKLQQQFNQHVFKLEQEEYVREKIEWKFIDFYDNQPCIDLIESKMGILDLLDEECKMPKGTDDTWVQKLYNKCSASKHFEKPRFSNSAFVINHFADQVQYESIGFLVKNRDTVMDEHINILKASQYGFVAELFIDEDEKKSTSRPVPAARSSIVSQKSVSGNSTVGQSQKQHKKTVGSQFRDSLNLLMSTLNSTNPHYIRCIKPNDEKMAFSFEPKRAVQQLRACGVLETIRISSAGFPSRWTYLEFFNRYRVLVPKSKDINRDNTKRTCEKILSHLIKDEDKFQFGKTKIFFRAGQVAYLEKLRSDRLRACGMLIQKHVRGWLQRRRYQKMRSAAITLQRYSRGCLARRQAHFLRRTRAAIVIQKNIRMFLLRKKFLQQKRSALLIQCQARGIWARQQFQQLRRERAAVIIQKWIRRWLAIRHYGRTRRAIVLLQCCVRRMRARRELKKLKIEARSVEHVKKLNIGLENKIISLQQKIGDLNKENNTLKANEINNKELQSKLQKMKDVEATIKDSSSRIAELQSEIQALRVNLERERGEKMDVISEKDNLLERNKELENRFNLENTRLKEDIDKANELIKLNEKNTEEHIRSKIENERTLLLQEFNDERTSYQKLLKNYARLEQGYENLQGEMCRLGQRDNNFERSEVGENEGNTLTVGGLHTRTPSSLSTISIQSDATEPVSDSQLTSFAPDEDMGYGSVRSKKAEKIKLDDQDWTDNKNQIGLSGDSSETVNLSLLLKLQQKVKELESEKARLEKRLDAQDGSETPPDEAERLRDLIKLQELEMENAKLKDNLNKLRRSAAEPGADGKELIRQFHAQQDELERRRDECIQLRTVLANKSQDMKHVAHDSYSGDVDIINEDGELLMAFASQKKLIRQLEAELQDEKRRCKTIEEEFRPEIRRLKEDNDRQQKLISQNLQKTPQAQTEAIMQHEITRLTGENLDLTEKNDGLTEQVKKLKRQLKIMAKRLKEAAGGEQASANAVETMEITRDMPVVKHKEVEYLGMFEYKSDDELTLIKNLVYDLRPKVAMTLLPGLPAYILFMCIRHSDYVNDDEKVRSLLTSTVNGIKRVIRKRHEDLEMVTLWLANTCRLLHNLKQYSGDKSFQQENTPKQNEQCLRNFDLSEYRQVLSDIAVWINQGVIKIMEEKVQPLIVPAVLEHEAIPGISGKPSGMRGRSSSVARELESPCIDARHALDILQKELTTFYRVLSLHGVDPEIITQIFKQIFYFICAGALNNLLLRKDMCHWSKGMQIRYNLSHLEQWCRDQRLQDSGVTESLQPIIQASQLLQARKTDEDVNSIVEMCDKLSIVQITKILNLYTPADEFEERIPVSFIRKIQARLMDRPESSDPGQGKAQGSFLMDTKFAFPLRFPFNPSNIQLEDISIPDVLNLPMLKKV